MSILIKGMEMPQNCGECPLRSEVIMPLRCKGVYGEPPIYTTEELPNEKALMSKRHSMCPLIELPPHGLIDKQMLLRNIADNQFAHSSVGHEDDYAFWGKVWDYINDAPIVVESEE